MDNENTLDAEAAPQMDEAQVDETTGVDNPVTSPDTASDNEKLLAGKFKSVEDLEKSYEQLQSEFTRTRQASRDVVEQVPSGGAEYPPGPNFQESTPGYGDSSPFDPTTQSALDSWYAQRRAEEKATEFAIKHKEELSDPVLDGTVRRLIADARDQRRYLDPEIALKQAKEIVDQRIKPVAATAKQEGFQEGHDIARNKELSGAIGEGAAREKVDPSKLSAEEYRNYLGLQYKED